MANGDVFKAIVIGNHGVGKTRMTYIYVNGEQPPEQETVGCEYFSKTIIFGATDSITREPVTKSIKINFYDTAGQEKYNSLTSSHYRNAHGAVVVYSVTDRASFKAAETWIKKVSEYAGNDCSLVLVANKVDVPNSQKQVSEEEGMRLAHRNSIEYYEVSATENSGIHEAMTGLARSMSRRYERRVANLNPSSP